jgi:protease-4
MAAAERLVNKKRAYLELSLKDEIVEGVPEHSIFSRKTRFGLHDIVEAVNFAARDSRIAALSLSLGKVVSGWAQLSDLRRALTVFRGSGKFIYCCMLEGGDAEYYLASACDRIYMPPTAHLNLVGLSAEVFFFRDLMDRLGVDAHIQSVGEYKSAAEMFTRTDLSPQAREQMDSLLDDHYDELCRAIQSRGVTRDEIASLIDSGPYTAREALEKRLLDGVCYQDEVTDSIKEQLGDKACPVPAHKYFKGDGFFKRFLTFRRARIAVIDIVGHIGLGQNRKNQAGRYVSGAETIGKFLDHASQSRRIRAIVLRINSPGGSGLASDLIWHKIQLAGKKKPVIASFGDVAASGGYYIASAASHIISEPTSITGSIGVLAGKFVARELMKHLAIHRESLRRGAHAEHGSPFSEFTAEEAESLKRQMLDFYREDFLKKVALGRKMEEEAVDQVGRGRVFSGRRAKDHNLVDEIGGISEAIQRARWLADIDESRKIRVVHYHKRRKLWERIMPDLHSPIMAGILAQPALDIFDIIDDLAGHTILLLMPYQIRIR